MTGSSQMLLPSKYRADVAISTHINTQMQSEVYAAIYVQVRSALYRTHFAAVYEKFISDAYKLTTEKRDIDA
jgi:hypothetical protein